MTLSGSVLRRVGPALVLLWPATGSAAPSLPKAPPILDFGVVDPAADPSPELPATITNTDPDEVLILTNIRIAGPDAARFGTATTSLSVPPGSPGFIPVIFDAAAAPGPCTAWITFETNAAEASGSPLAVGLLAGAVPQPPPPPAAPLPPRFSVPSSTFTEPFEVSITPASEPALVVVTTDGSAPDRANGRLALSPMSISRSTELRAAAIAPGAEPSLARASWVRLAPDAAAYQSPLPIAIVDNFGRGRIPDKRWTTSTQTGAGLQQVHRQPAALLVMGSGEGAAAAAASGAPSLAATVGIRVRGAFSSTWFPQPYSIEGRDADDTDADIAPLGMASDSDWILYYPHPSYDRTLLFNTFIWELSRATGRWAPDFRFVDLFVNEDGGDLTLADRRGVYALVEKVKRGQDRLDFEALSEDGSRGGWLLAINRMDPEPEDGFPAPNGAASPQFFHTAGPNRLAETPPNTAGRGDDIPRQYNAFINFESPNGYRISPSQRTAIEGWFTAFEDVLYDDATWLDPHLGYRRHLDTRDFIGYFQLLNLARQSDGLLLSMFPWVSSGDRRLRMGPMWDFNNGVYDGAGNPESVLYFRQDRLWYPRLFEDPHFLREYIDHWFEMRRGPLADAAMHAIIDRQAAAITEPLAVAQGLGSAANWRSRLSAMKSWLSRRAAWIDAQYFAPPVFSLPAGIVETGAALAITPSGPAGGTIHFTLDGSDPLPGFGEAEVRESVLVPESSAASALVPSVANGGSALLPADWTEPEPPPNAGAWTEGLTGAGFGYPEFTGLDLAAMKGVNGSAFLRIPFDIPDAGAIADWTGLTLRLRFEDGFVAWLNGEKVASFNAPGTAFWNSTATGARLDSDAVVPLEFDLAPFLDRLRPGANLLAIHLLNATVGNSDILALPELVASQVVEISPSAAPYTAPVILDRSTTVSARVRSSDGEWSALQRAVYLTGPFPSPESLVVAELHYHPAEDGEETEFVELMNIDGQTTLDLSGSAFTEGIRFSMPVGTRLEPGERLVVARNPQAIRSRYGMNVRVAGPFEGRLDNAGETLALTAPDGTTVLRFAYGDDPPWPEAADGLGFSLVLAEPETGPDPSLPGSWTAGRVPGGTPGRGEGRRFTGSAEDDSDRDGTPDLVEFAIHRMAPDGSPASDPEDPRGEFFRASRLPDGTLEVDFLRRVDVADIELAIEVSADLRDWDAARGAVTAFDPVPGQAFLERVTWRIDPMPDRAAPAFVRLRVRLTEDR